MGCFCFCLGGGTPVAYGGSRARGLTGATAASLRHSHSNADPSHICNLHHSSPQCRILNPLSKARNQTCNLMVPSQVHFCYNSAGTPVCFSYLLCFSYLFIYLFISLFRATHMAYGGSQDRDRIRAVAAGLQYSHNNARSESHLQPTPQLMATLDP